MNYTLERLEIHAVDHCNLACIGCNHWSPFFKKREYVAADYGCWIQKIKALRVHIRKLAITGGEPFLNKGLGDLVRGVKEAAGADEVEIFTNLFWLKDESSIDKHDSTLSQVDRLHYSLYQPIVDKVGIDQIHCLLDLIMRKYPDLKVSTFVDGVVKEFGQVIFYDKPVERYATQDCPVKVCTQLRSDGKVYRCTHGLAIESHPGATEGFKASKDIVYDLTADSREFSHWASKWPLDACAYCSCGIGKASTPHVSDTAIRDMSKEQYKDRVIRLMFEGR